MIAMSSNSNMMTQNDDGVVNASSENADMNIKDVREDLSELQRILALPQIEQQTSDWYKARRNKQSASDFGAVVPRTSQYIQHIVDRWQSDDLKEKRRTQSVTSQYCYTFGPDQYYLQKVHLESKDAQLASASGSFGTSTACASGQQFETVIRNAAAQHLGFNIVEMGWVEGQHTPHAGVSPDGLVLDNLMTLDRHEHQHEPHWYMYEHDATAEHPQNVLGFAFRGPKNFEAKTIVSRPMIQKVPLKYHIQVERTAFELGTKSSIYTEAKFTTLHHLSWQEQVLAASDKDFTAMRHLAFGIMLSRYDPDTKSTQYIYADVGVKTPAQFLQWAETEEAKLEDATIHQKRIHFRLDAMWCVEIPLWEKYAEVYGPLIIKEAEKLHWFATTPEGEEEYMRLHKAREDARSVRRKKKNFDAGKAENECNKEDIQALYTLLLASAPMN